VSTFLNFAYGSNMLTQRLRARAPSARPITVAVLVGHELRWHKIGQDSSGKCDAMQVDTLLASVIGVVHEIRLSEKPALDAAEGLGRGYGEKQVVLEVEGAEAVQAQIYFATQTEASVVPYTWYKALVVAGARQHGLPEAYIATLEATVAKVDADVQRAAKHFAIANAG
jgi:hypothetical protein